MCRCYLNYQIDNDLRRDLNIFLASDELANLSVDADEGNGELSITIPESCRDSIKSIHFDILKFTINKIKNSN